MFEYFPENYPWSMAVVTTLDSGGIASEIDDACAPLRAFVDGDPEAAVEAWLEQWGALARRVEAAASADAEEGHALSAGEKYLRSALYYLVAERQASPRDAKKRELYDAGLGAFRRGLEARGERVELVDVPYEGGTLPSLFVPAESAGPAPCIIHFNGLDSNKELQYFRLAEAYAARGIASLFCDQPGSGGALRVDGLAAVVETERPAAACLDYLETRSDVDPERIGIQGVSMGGYYAPRAAAFEPRLACCVAFGAFYDFAEVAKLSLERGASYANSVSDMRGQLRWVSGHDDFGDAVRFFAGFTLQGVAERITCPLLVVHGGRDRQIPGDHGQKTYDDAKRSARRTLVVLDDDEGGVEHCSADNIPRARAIMADWIADVLESQPL